MTSTADTTRAAGAMGLVIGLSRLTGFVRILVVAAVLGTTYLGNAYQTTNTIPNIVFELFAAGALQAVLVPSMVRLHDGSSKGEAEEVAGSVLGALLVVLGIATVVGVCLAPSIAGFLFAGVEDPSIRAQQTELGTMWLRIFLPQVVFYASSVVAAGVLNSRDEFVVPAAAPMLNNLIVTSVLGIFWLMRDGAPPSLDLSGSQSWVLAGGTTLAVVAFTSIPLVALRRGGFELRPRLSFDHPEVRRIARTGGWASLQLASGQLLLLVALVLANRSEGGVVAYQVGYMFFLLPHALISVPIFTTMYTAMSRQAALGDLAALADTAQRGLSAIAVLTLPVTAVLTVLAWPAAKVALFGEAAGDGVGMTAGAIAAFAPGVVAFGASMLLTRAYFAKGEARAPALISLAASGVGAVLMVAVANVAHGDARVSTLAGCHTLAQFLTAACMLVGLGRELGGVRRLVALPVVRAAAAAAVSGAVMFSGGAGIGGITEVDTRLGAGIAGSGLALIGVVAYVACCRLVGLGDPRGYLRVRDAI